MVAAGKTPNAPYDSIKRLSFRRTTGPHDRPFNTTGGKSTLEYKHPWRTRKLEEASAGDCAQEAQQKNELAPDVIRKATSLQHSDGFDSIM
jgi:hypothetical protein